MTLFTLSILLIFSLPLCETPSTELRNYSRSIIKTDGFSAIVPESLVNRSRYSKLCCWKLSIVEDQRCSHYDKNSRQNVYVFASDRRDRWKLCGNVFKGSMVTPTDILCSAWQIREASINSLMKLSVHASCLLVMH